MSNRNEKLRWDAWLNDDQTQGNMGASRTSRWVEVNGRDFSIQYSWPSTGTPVGSVSFETSNDDGTTVDAIDPSYFDVAPENPAGTAGSHTAHFEGLNVARVRMVYTRTSGGTNAALRATCQTEEA